jgi:hypothetical protein
MGPIDAKMMDYPVKNSDDNDQLISRERFGSERKCTD